MNKLLAENVLKFHGKQKILDNISINCNSGEIVSLFGANGSGKSTLLEIIFGSIHANNADIIINDIKIKNTDLIEFKKIAYLPQKSFLSKSSKVCEIIKLFSQNIEIQDKIFYSPRIANIENKNTGNLSLGELRYFEFLLISHLDRQFLLLDEPFSMIEPIYIEIIKDRLNLIKKERGIILTDHYYNHVLEITDRKLLIKDKKIIVINDNEELVKYKYINDNYIIKNK